jgi:hypothetical protein
MTRNALIRALLALAFVILGSLQAWDSDAYNAGLLVVFLVSVAIALPAVAIQAPLSPAFLLGSILASLLLLIVARLVSPLPLSGLFLVLLIPGFSLIYVGILAGRSGGAPPPG